MISVWAARGGHGATTVAGALGAILKRGVSSDDPDSFEWVWPRLSETTKSRRVTIHDGGVFTVPDNSRINIVVLRGPCSTATHHLAFQKKGIDHLVLIHEPWRSLRRVDIEHALGLPVAAEIPFSSRVARLIDAGLMTTRGETLDEFSDLETWALKTFVEGRGTHTTANTHGSDLKQRSG